MDLFTPSLDRLFDTWLDEDIGRGDLTAIAVQDTNGSAYWLAKQSGILCGLFLVQKLFHRLDSSVKVNVLARDGSQISSGQRILELQGPKAALLAGERTALNLVMRLSGIATTTARLVAELKGTGVILTDTRKTTPGLRVLEKYAVKCGGGLNHRLGLDDAAMLKENHLAWVKNMPDAISLIRSSAPWPSRIIVEAETESQAEEAVLAGADSVLLDEFSPEELTIIVPRLRKLAQKRSIDGGVERIILEASGVDTKKIKAYAASGVDFISTSAPVTKSSWLDMSMRFDQIE